MNTVEAVQKRIQQLCEQKKIRPHRLSVLAGLPSSTVKSILNGQSQNPGIVTLQKICNGLDLTLIEFFDDELFRS